MMSFVVFEPALITAFATYWSYRLGKAARGVFRNEPSAWAQALGIDLSLWKAIGWVNVIHSVIWFVIAALGLLDRVSGILVLSIFAYGMMMCDLIISIPMYDRMQLRGQNLYKKNFRKVAFNIAVQQGLFVMYIIYRSLF